MKDNIPKELKGDSRRQAVPTIKGFAYQFWQSVYRWITLEENEILFLEGAEDFDVISSETATTVQIKNTQKSFTLNSKEIIEVINNYCKHRKENQGRLIEFHFITSAQRGMEKDTPFGTMCGLDYWESCERPNVILAPLKDYLLKSKNLSDEVHQYIINSSDYEIREELIKRIKWLTGSRDLEQIKELVEKKVYYYGEGGGIPYKESKKVIPALLKHVLDVICKKENRKLEKFDFIKLFEDSTRISVSYQTFNVLDQILGQKDITQIIAAIGEKTDIGEVQLGKSFEFFPTLLPDKYIDRQQLVHRLLNVLEFNWILVIKGTAGTGKSTLARLLTDAEKSTWIWINARSHKPHEIKELLFRIAIKVSDKINKLVINDLAFGPGYEEYQSALEALLYSVYSSDGKIILTTQGDLPTNISLNMRITSESVIDIPLLKSEEIKKLATEYGCVDAKQLDIWTKVIYAKTHGHPQLAHAWIKNLSVNKWPKFQLDDLLKDEHIETVRREARSKLIEQLPSVEARALVYKLSVAGLPFRRDHAIELGQRIRGLNNPGEIFDYLIGPWIEKIGDKYYRLSPLLENSANKVWGRDEIVAVQKEIAETVANCSSLTLLEANIILLNGIISGTGKPVLGVITSLLRAPDKSWGKISKELDWITAIGLEPGIKAFPSDPFINIYLRQMQYRIAIEKNENELAAKIADLWERDLEYGQTPELKLIDRLMFILKTIINFQVSFSQEVIIFRIIELMNKEKEINKIFNVSSIFENMPLKRKPYESLFLFSIIRCKNRNDLNELINVLEKQPIKIRNSLISLLQAENDPSEILLNKVFMSELDSGAPDWDRCIEIIEKAIEYAISWNIENMAIAAYRTIAIIQYEQLKNSEKGLEVLNTAKARLGYEHPFLSNERATILYNQKRYREALKVWDDAFEEWPHDTVFKPIYHFSYALVCAAKEGEWGKVKNMALKGREIATQIENNTLATAFLAEYALALWKEKAYQESINTFSDILDELTRLPNPNEHTLSYKLHKLIGHALAWMTQEIGGHVQLAEPQTGCFSNQDIDEKIREYPLQPTGFMWYFLADLEYKIGTGKSMLKRLEKESLILSIPILNYQVEHIKIGHSLRNLEFETLVSDFKKCYRNFGISRKHAISGLSLFEKADINQISQNNDSLLKDSQLLPPLILGALIKLMNNGKYSDAPVGKWKDDTNHLQLSGFDEYFQLIQDAPQKSTQELIQLMKEGKTEIRYLAALSISSRELIKPVYRLYADLTLVHAMKLFPWIEAVEIDIEQMTSRNWKKVTGQQSFELSAPRINIPIIEKACGDPSKGLKKVAKILLAAKNAVQLSIPDVELNQLKELANNE